MEVVPSSVCDEKTFEGLFMEHAKSLRDYLFFLSGDNGLSEDLVQDIFFKLWEKCKDVPFDKVRSFLFVVGKNQFLKDVEKKKVRLNHRAGLSERVDKEDPQHKLEQDEFKARLENAIDALPDGQKEVFLMNRIQKMTYGDIAEHLEISQKAVEKRMSKALKKMKDLLHPNKG